MRKCYQHRIILNNKWGKLHHKFFNVGSEAESNPKHSMSDNGDDGIPNLFPPPISPFLCVHPLNKILHQLSNTGEDPRLRESRWETSCSQWRWQLSPSYTHRWKKSKCTSVRVGTNLFHFFSIKPYVRPGLVKPSLELDTVCLSQA